MGLQQTSPPFMTPTVLAADASTAQTWEKAARPQSEGARDPTIRKNNSDNPPALQRQEEPPERLHSRIVACIPEVNRLRSAKSRPSQDNLRTQGGPARATARP